MEMTINVNISAPELCRTLERLVDLLCGTPAAARPACPTPAAQQPVPAAPVPATQQPVPAAPVPATQQPIPAAPATVPATAPAGAVPPAAAIPQASPAAIPISPAPAYTLDQISRAGAALVDAGKMEPLLALLAKYGVQAITQIPPAQYGVFATELRALGAQI